MFSKAVVCAAMIAAASSAPASAAFFSFASDADHTSWTFAGLGASVGDAQDPSDPQLLLIDDDNGPLLPVLLGVEFEADFRLSYLGSLPFVGGKFTHTYKLDGTFAFLDAASGAPVLSCSITDGLLTAVGNGGPAPTWDSTATIQGSDGYGIVTYTWYGPSMPEYNLFKGDSVGPDDAAFTLTVLNHLTGLGTSLGSTSYLPTQEWWSEGSYSGSTVPAPASLALTGLAGLLVSRRRR